jgi:hypothetical protein
LKDNQNRYEFLDDTKYEGRDKAYFDIDRMVNEGMCGGSVHRLDTAANIEEAVHITAEEPPRQA